MKMLTNHKMGVFFTLIFSLLSAFTAKAADETVYNFWGDSKHGAGNDGSYATMSTSNHTYRIIIWGDVTFEGGCMFVGDPNGGTSGITCILEVANDHVGDVVIKNGGTNSFFRVLPNNTLIIKGSADKRIIFDGGATTTTDNGTSNEMIGTAGTIVLQHVVFRNNVNTDGWNPAIKINPEWTHLDSDKLIDEDNKIGKTTILNCEFSKLKGKLSPVLYCDETRSSLKHSANTPTSCGILIKDTTIHDCTVIEGDGRSETDAGQKWGGLIRTRGGWVGNLTMTNVKMYDNKASDCSCAGIFWNAFGNKSTRKPVLTLKGCEFYGNYTKYSGGAIRIETDCTFDSIPTKIHDNTAEVMGGGIHIYGYAGGSTTEFTTPMTFNYDLNQNLEVYNNKAQYGGAIGFQLTNSCKLYKGSSFNAHFNGAKIYDNKATVKGGGLYFEDITSGTKAGIFDVNFYLNKGTINGNIASPTPNNPAFADGQTVATTFYDTLNGAGSDRLKSSGGGVFLYNANIEYEENLAGTMTMDGNKASRFGGAIAVLGTEALLDIQGLTASSNEAWRGGGLACYSLTDDQAKYAGIRLGNLTLSGNKAYDYGGGAFIEKGKLEILNNATITGCTATNRGGGVSCLVNSIINLNNATISGCTANLGAGLDLEESTLDMNNATFSGNIADSNGGGLYVEKNANFKIYGRAQFLNNESTNDGGGGICLKTNDGYSSTGNSIENAFFSGNKAYRGGAIELDGVKDTEAQADNLTLTLNNAEFTNNEANLGGAILVNEAKLTYKGGLIYGNKAVLRPGSNLPKTSFGYFPYAYYVNCFHDRQFSGFGGGIIVSKMGSLIIEGGSPFGIYGNSADIAGNDISTVCSDKTIYNGGSNMDKSSTTYHHKPATLTIPQPESLDLTGFKIPIPKAAVKWMEDYNSEDGAYSKGTNRQGSTHERYGTLLKSADGMKKLSNLIVDATTMKAAIDGYRYLHLTLGYNFVFVKLVKQGLKAGESAIFNISYKDGSNYVKYMNVLVTNTTNTDGAEASQIIALSSGDWLFEETSWAWAYNRPNSKEITLTDADASNMPSITFTNTRITDIDSKAPNAEGYKQNEFKD